MLKIEVKDKKTKIQGKETDFHECLYAFHTLIDYIKSHNDKLTNEDIYKFIDMIDVEMKEVK